MSDPEVLDRILQTCSFRSRDVVCPNKDKIASITAAKFHVEDDEDWSVLECSLQPDGEQLTEFRANFFGRGRLRAAFFLAWMGRECRKDYNREMVVA